MVLSLGDDCLYRVPYELANDVLQVTLNIGKGGIQMTLDSNLGDLYVRAASGPDKLLGCPTATLYNLFGIAFQKDFADSINMRVVFGLVVWKVPGRIEGVGECQMLLCDDAS